MLRESIRGLIRKFGFDVVSFDAMFHPLARRMSLLRTHDIDVVFDVGANTGQYATKLRELGYSGRIVSFEPLSTAYKDLVKYASTDPLWSTENIALGSRDGSAKINIAGNSQSSSLLEMLPEHVRISPDSHYIGTETVTLKKLDSIIDNYLKPSNRLFLKIDAQGYEKEIIDGAEKSFERIVGIQTEASLIELYKGETLLVDTIKFMLEKNYTLMSMEPTYANPSTGQLLQVDCIFFRV